MYLRKWIIWYNTHIPKSDVNPRPLQTLTYQPLLPNTDPNTTASPSSDHPPLHLPPGDMLVKDRQYFKNGHLDREGLVRFIKEVKKHPGLTDEDAAVLAASKWVRGVRGVG